MGVFDFLKKKKTQSELMLEASKNFLMGKNINEDINPNEERNESSYPKDVSNLNQKQPYSPEQEKGLFYPPPFNENPPEKFENPEKNIPEALYPFSFEENTKNAEKETIQNPSLEDVIYELRTIKTQNDLIIDMLRQIQRKLNM